MYYGYGQMREHESRSKPFATAEAAQALVDDSLARHTEHGHVIVSSGVEETPEGWVGVVVYQMEGDVSSIQDDRELEEQEQTGPGEVPVPEAKSRTGLYVGLGLGALALAGIGYAVVRSRKRR